MVLARVRFPRSPLSNNYKGEVQMRATMNMHRNGNGKLDLCDSDGRAPTISFGQCMTGWQVILGSLAGFNIDLVHRLNDGMQLI